jgi:hypothetical protein
LLFAIALSFNILLGAPKAALRMASRSILFSGRRWPHAQVGGRQTVAVALADGSFLTERGFANIIAHGEGRVWTPEANDASWRNLAELDLDDPRACADFAKRRGDPSGALRPGPTHVSSSQWFALAQAVQVAAQAWDPPGDDGVSHPTSEAGRLVEAAAFLSHPAAANALTLLSVVPDPAGGPALALRAGSLAGFLVARCAQALEDTKPMRRCAVCGFWFEIRRARREPQFCSASCRALHHEQRRK